MLLMVVAAVTLVVGLLADDGLAWIWASIAASLAAGLFLLIGVLRARPTRGPAPGGVAPASWSGAGARVHGEEDRDGSRAARDEGSRGGASGSRGGAAPADPASGGSAQGEPARGEWSQGWSGGRPGGQPGRREPGRGEPGQGDGDWAPRDRGV